MNATAPPFRYFGGKTRTSARIAALLPPHGHYVEPFAGSLAVLLAKPPAPFETVNDLDQHLMTFWRVLRDAPKEFARVCASTPYARAEYDAADFTAPDLSDMERARRVWVQLSQGRAGTLRNTGWRQCRAPSRALSGPGYLAAYVRRMPVVARRLARVSLECRDALDVIADYGRHPECLIYADPPYLGEVRNSTGYRLEMRAVEQHEQLAAVLRACKASVVLSGYDSPLYDRLYDGWRTARIRTGDGTRDRTEVLWIRGEQALSLFDGLG